MVTSPAYLDTAVTDGTPYWYTVTAVNTAGAHDFSAAASYNSSGQTITVDSPTLTAYAATLTVPNVGWQKPWSDGGIPVGYDFYAPLTATLSSGLDSDGTGPTYAVYTWSVVGTWESDNDDTADPDDPTDLPAIPFTTCGAPGGQGWAETGSGIGSGTDSVNFDGAFSQAGYYIVQVQCTATIYDSSTGALIGAVSGTGYIGGDGPPATGHALLAHATAAAKKPVWVTGPSVSLTLVSEHSVGSWTDAAGNELDWGSGNSFSETDGADWIDAGWTSMSGSGYEEFVFALPSVVPAGAHWSLDYVIFVNGGGEQVLVSASGAGLSVYKEPGMRKTVEGPMKGNVKGNDIIFDTPPVKLIAQQDGPASWDATLAVTFDYAKPH